MTTRRDFLKGVAAVGTVSSLTAESNASTASSATEVSQSAVSALPPSHYEESMEVAVPDGYTAEEAAHYFVQHPASDFMVDVIKSLDIDYMASNPGSSFRGLQESIIAYGGNSKPEFLTCLHEESAVAMSHGYAKIAYKPMAVACHGTVGLQHAAMAVYNAYCDRVPIIILAGNHMEATGRRPGAEWSHAAQDCAKLVRDFTKWDDIPLSLTHFAESLVRAYKIATTPPMGPVVIVLDGHLQEEETNGVVPPIPPYTPTTPPQGESGAVREAARLLVNAENPVIITGRVAHTPEGMELMVELAEALQAPVVAGRGGRMNFPNDHYLSQSGGRLVRQADVILGLEQTNFWSTVNSMRDLVHRDERRVVRDDVKLISIGVNDLFLKANYQNFQRFQPVDLSIGGDAQATLPSLIEEVKRQMSAQRRSRLADRAAGFRRAHAEAREQARKRAAYGWNDSPVSMARISMELWDQVKDRDWSLVGGGVAVSNLWTINRHYHRIGGSGGSGIGYGSPASVGAALANREHGRLSVSIQKDGDFNYAPGVLWTAAHHNIPLLALMHNNRGYHQEVMHLQRMASRRQRGADGLAKIGNTFEDPFIDYATVAKGLGLWTAGPINDPNEVGPAIRRAIDVVDQGEPALIDIVCQPR